MLIDSELIQYKKPPHLRWLNILKERYFKLDLFNELTQLAHNR